MTKRRNLLGPGIDSPLGLSPPAAPREPRRSHDDHAPI
jgi:hypothetical protein